MASTVAHRTALKEGQRIHAKVSDTAITSSKKGAVFEGAHAPALRALNLVIRDMENRKIREHNTN